MARARSKVVDYLVYVVVRFTVAVLQALPFATACRLTELLAWIAYQVDRRHRVVAEENLAHAFPGEHTPEERARVVLDVYRHFLRLLIEIIHIPRMVRITNYKQFFKLSHPREITSALISDRSVLVVTGHLGNWEMAGYCLGLLGFTTHAIARTLDNPYLDNFLRLFRERTGQHILAKKGDFEQIQSVLDSGGILATLADQDAGQRGQFVEYFGRPASTHKAVALMAIEYDVLMLVTGTVRTGSGLSYEVRLSEIIDPRDFTGRPDAVKVITQRFTTALERLVRGAPSQYFWLHRRWKHQPAPKKTRQAA